MLRQVVTFFSFPRAAGKQPGERKSDSYSPRTNGESGHFSTSHIKLMLQKLIYWCALGLLLIPTQIVFAENTYDPPALMLTWKRDPARTMCVHWQTEDEAKPEVHWRPLGATNGWTRTTGSTREMPFSERTIHLVELTGLQPDSDYEFCFLPGERAFRFRTLPTRLEKPLRFINGGDMHHERQWLDEMNELAGKLNPAFVVIGGDLAYALHGDLKEEQMDRWNAFFDSWKNKAKAPDGRLVPLVVTIGNHEVAGSYNKTPDAAKVFYAVFPLPGPEGYACLDFGDYLSLVLLDSGHTHPVAGAQTAWLENALAQRRAVPHVFPVYHVPAYPSFRGEAANNLIIRTNWTPLFERNGVKVAFEHHDHTFKRTHPIKDGKIDPDGVVYVGDGAWGVKVRIPEQSKSRWYLARAGQVRHLWMVTLTPEARQLVAVDEKGRFFDEVYQRVKPADVSH